jgi:hypothetical protein
MKRLPLVLMLVVAAFPGAAPAAGCSPLDCAPSQASLDGGRLLAVRAGGVTGIVRVLDLGTGVTRWHLPPGVLAGDTLVHQDGSLLTWYDAATGMRVRDTVAQLRGVFQLVGTSQDGTRAVLARTQAKRTTFAVVSPGHPTQIVTLPTDRWGFDALAGERLFVLQYMQNGYEVRAYDLLRQQLEAKPLKDANEAALIAGSAWERLSSRDGRYLFTLYITGDGDAMVHELDLRSATAHCIDLPGSGNFNGAAAYAFSLSPDGRTLWVASPVYGKVVGIDVATAQATTSFSFKHTYGGSPTSAVAALSPDGRSLVLALAPDVWRIDLTRHRGAELKAAAPSIALGFSPDGKTLWRVSQRSRVSKL